jgi:hypothetical protein
MDTTQILNDLRTELSRIDQAIAALESLNGTGAPAATPAATAAAAVAPTKGKRRISPEGMARIVAATKARWARLRRAKAAGAGAKRKGAAVAAKAAPAGARRLSPAAKKRLSELAKARWAKAKKQGKKAL